jgi:hypothetical protein
LQTEKIRGKIFWFGMIVAYAKTVPNFFLRFGIEFAEAAILAGRAGDLPLWQFRWL